MTDYFKTIRAYLRGKWGRKRVGLNRAPGTTLIEGGKISAASITCNGLLGKDDLERLRTLFKGPVAGPEFTPAIDRRFATKAVLPGTIYVGGIVLSDWTSPAQALHDEIARLRRNKKKHSHLQKQLDDLLNGGAQISDQQTENTK